jgi:hypothetical protein
MMYADAGSENWDGQHMAQTEGTIETDALACQTRCANTPNCAYFTFWVHLGRCNLQDTNAELRLSPSGFDGDIKYSWPTQIGPNVKADCHDGETTEVAVFAAPKVGSFTFLQHGQFILHDMFNPENINGGWWQNDGFYLKLFWSTKPQRTDLKSNDRGLSFWWGQDQGWSLWSDSQPQWWRSLYEAAPLRDPGYPNPSILGFAQHISKTDYHCVDAFQHVLTPTNPCTSTDIEGNSVKTCVQNIDECATLIEQHMDICTNIGNYYGNRQGPSGSYPGLCSCLKHQWQETRSGQSLACNGFDQAGGNVFQSRQYGGEVYYRIGGNDCFPGQEVTRSECQVAGGRIGLWMMSGVDVSSADLTKPTICEYYDAPDGDTSYFGNSAAIKVKNAKDVQGRKTTWLKPTGNVCKESTDSATLWNERPDSTVVGAMCYYYLGREGDVATSSEAVCQPDGRWHVDTGTVSKVSESACLSRQSDWDTLCGIETTRMRYNFAPGDGYPTPFAAAAGDVLLYPHEGYEFTAANQKCANVGGTEESNIFSIWVPDSDVSIARCLVYVRKTEGCGNYFHLGPSVYSKLAVSGGQKTGVAQQWPVAEDNRLCECVRKEESACTQEAAEGYRIYKVIYPTPKPALPPIEPPPPTLAPTPAPSPVPRAVVLTSLVDGKFSPTDAMVSEAAALFWFSNNPNTAALVFHLTSSFVGASKSQNVQYTADSKSYDFDGLTSEMTLDLVSYTSFTIALEFQATSTEFPRSTNWVGLPFLATIGPKGRILDRPFYFGLCFAHGKVYFDGNSMRYNLDTGTGLHDGHWHKVVATFRGESGIMELRVDDVMQSMITGTNVGDEQSAEQSDGFEMVFGRKFKGSIRNLYIFDQALDVNAAPSAPAVLNTVKEKTFQDELIKLGDGNLAGLLTYAEDVSVEFGRWFKNSLLPTYTGSQQACGGSCEIPRMVDMYRSDVDGDAYPSMRPVVEACTCGAGVFAFLAHGNSRPWNCKERCYDVAPHRSGGYARDANIVGAAGPTTFEAGRPLCDKCPTSHALTEATTATECDGTTVHQGDQSITVPEDCWARVYSSGTAYSDPAPTMQVVFEATKEPLRCVHTRTPVTCAQDAGNAGKRKAGGPATATFIISTNATHVCAGRTDAALVSDYTAGVKEGLTIECNIVVDHDALTGHELPGGIGGKTYSKQDLLDRGVLPDANAKISSFRVVSNRPPDCTEETILRLMMVEHLEPGLDDNLLTAKEKEVLGDMARFNTIGKFRHSKLAPKLIRFIFHDALDYKNLEDAEDATKKTEIGLTGFDGCIHVFKDHAGEEGSFKQASDKWTPSVVGHIADFAGGAALEVFFRLHSINDWGIPGNSEKSKSGQKFLIEPFNARAGNFWEVSNRAVLPRLTRPDMITLAANTAMEAMFGFKSKLAVKYGRWFGDGCHGPRINNPTKDSFYANDRRRRTFRARRQANALIQAKDHHELGGFESINMTYHPRLMTVEVSPHEDHKESWCPIPKVLNGIRDYIKLTEAEAVSLFGAHSIGRIERAGKMSCNYMTNHFFCPSMCPRINEAGGMRYCHGWIFDDSPEILDNRYFANMMDSDFNAIPSCTALGATEGEAEAVPGIFKKYLQFSSPHQNERELGIVRFGMRGKGCFPTPWVPYVNASQPRPCVVGYKTTWEDQSQCAIDRCIYNCIHVDKLCTHAWTDESSECFNCKIQCDNYFYKWSCNPADIQGNDKNRCRGRVREHEMPEKDGCTGDQVNWGRRVCDIRQYNSSSGAPMAKINELRPFRWCKHFGSVEGTPIRGQSLSFPLHLQYTPGPLRPEARAWGGPGIVMNMEQFGFLHTNPTPIYNLPVDWSLLGSASTKDWVRKFGENAAEFEKHFTNAWDKVTNAGWDAPVGELPKSGWTGSALKTCRKVSCTAKDGKFYCPVDVLSDRLRYLPKPASLRLELGDCLLSDAATGGTGAPGTPPDAAAGDCDLVGGFGVRGTIQCGTQTYHCCTERACEWETWLKAHRKADLADTATCPFTKEEKQAEIDRTVAHWRKGSDFNGNNGFSTTEEAGLDFEAAYYRNIHDESAKVKRGKTYFFSNYVKGTLPRELLYPRSWGPTYLLPMLIGHEIKRGLAPRQVLGVTWEGGIFGGFMSGIDGPDDVVPRRDQLWDTEALYEHRIFKGYEGVPFGSAPTAPAPTASTGTTGQVSPSTSPTTSPTTPSPTAGPLAVTVAFTLPDVDFTTLSTENKKNMTAGICEGVTETAGIALSRCLATLTAGSVNVEVTIQPPPAGTDSDQDSSNDLENVVATLEASQVEMKSAVIKKLEAIENLPVGASTFTMSGLVVSKEAAPSPAPTTVERTPAPVITNGIASASGFIWVRSPFLNAVAASFLLALQ